MTDQPTPQAAVWVDGDPLMEAIAATVHEHCEHSGSGLVIDDPRNIAAWAAAAMRTVPVVPVSSPPPDQTAEVDQLRADLQHETERRQRWQRKYNAEHARHVEVVRAFVTNRAAVLLWAADQIDTETRKAKADGVLEPDRFRPCRDASAQLRALAGCQECASGLEHDVHCPTPETHNWGCGCPSDPVPADGPSRLAAEAQQPDTETRAERPRCPHCHLPHDLDPGGMAVRACESIRASLAEDETRL